MTLRELNEKYFELFSDLRLALEYLPNKQYDKMAKVLDEQYQQELDIVLTQQLLAHGIENFELKYRAATEIPKDRRFLWIFPRRNRTAKVLRKVYAAQYAKFLAELDQMRVGVRLDVKDVQAETQSMQEESSANLPAGSSTNETSLPQPAVTGQTLAPTAPEEGPATQQQIK